MSVSDRLGRLLFIVPYVVHRDGVPLQELAQVLGVTPQQIQADLDLLSMVGQPPLTPDHLIDLYVEDEIVYVELDQNLTRPLRLTHEEARALVLGAKLVGDLGGWGQELERVLARIMEHLNPVDRQAVQALSQRVLVQGSQPDPQTAATACLRECIEARWVVSALYYSVSSDRQKRYALKPLALFTHGGMDYLVALDCGAEDHEKLFRLDRLGRVQATDLAFTPPEDFDLEKFRTPRLYFGADNLQARVRFAANLARQVRERFAAHDIVATHADGSLEVRLATSSAAWLARWVLSFGLDAEVLAPASYRGYLRSLCEAAMAAYERPVTPATKEADPPPERRAAHTSPLAAPPV